MPSAAALLPRVHAASLPSIGEDALVLLLRLSEHAATRGTVLAPDGMGAPPCKSTAYSREGNPPKIPNSLHKLFLPAYCLFKGTLSRGERLQKLFRNCLRALCLHIWVGVFFFLGRQEKPININILGGTVSGTNRTCPWDKLGPVLGTKSFSAEFHVPFCPVCPCDGSQFVPGTIVPQGP